MTESEKLELVNRYQTGQPNAPYANRLDELMDKTHPLTCGASDCSSKSQAERVMIPFIDDGLVALRCPACSSTQRLESVAHLWDFVTRGTTQ